MTEGLIDNCYWTRTSDRDEFPRLNGDVTVDVAIIGGGIVGTIAARLLRDRGHSVAVLEAGRVGHGVTGRSTAKVTAQHSLFLQRIEKDHGQDAARAYVDANRAGVSLIGGLVEKYRLACDFEPADSFVYATTTEGAEELERERGAAERAGLGMELLADAGLPYPTTGALRLSGQAQFQPVTFTTSLAASLSGDGSFVFEGSCVVDWSETTVATETGSVRARHVIMATHLPLGQVGQFHVHTNPHMHAIMAVPVDPARAPAGMYISADEPKRSLRSHRALSGETMLILTGPTFKQGDVAAEQDGFAHLEAFARERFGCGSGGYRWSNEDYGSRDGLPYVGWSGSSGKSLLVATGFDAWGLSNGAAAALILADLCDGRENSWSDRFDASRHSLTGLSKLASNAVKITADLVGGHLRGPKDDRSAAFEGAIIDIGGRTAGVFEDDSGQLRAVSAICTHMGCVLGWNPIDRTWDCSCHGSRFAAEGSVVHGPTTERLSPLELPDDLQEFGR